MKLNKKVKYGFLFTIYLARNKRSTVEKAAQDLNLSSDFLAQIARLLRKTEVIKSVRGPGGGYEINGNPSVLRVLTSLDTLEIIQAEKSNGVEHQAFQSFTSKFVGCLHSLLNFPIKDVYEHLLLKDIASESEQEEVTSYAG